MPPINAPLSPRQRQILNLTAQGLRQAEIAERLCIAVETVKYNRDMIRAKLRVDTMRQAVETAIQSGLISLDEEVQDA